MLEPQRLALLYPIPDWPALSVACTVLSSVKLGKSLSRDRCPTSSLLLQDRVAVHSQDVVDATDTKIFTKESEFCLRVLTQLDTFVHAPSDVCLGQGLGPR